MAGTFRIKQLMREHDLTNRLHIYMSTRKSWGQNARQVWANPFLQQGKEMDNTIRR